MASILFQILKNDFFFGKENFDDFLLLLADH